MDEIIDSEEMEWDYNSRPLLFKDSKTGEIICVTIEADGDLEASFFRVAKAFFESHGEVDWAFFGMSTFWVKKSKLKFGNSDIPEA